jgi:hypothetical protein
MYYSTEEAEYRICLNTITGGVQSERSASPRETQLPIEFPVPL